MIVKTILIVSVAAFYFPVMPRRPWTQYMMFYSKFCTENIERMDALCFHRVCKLTAAVCLYFLWSIAEADNCSLHKIYGGIAAMFLIGVDKALSGRLFNDCVLIVLLRLFAGVTRCGHVFDVQLPLFT